METDRSSKRQEIMSLLKRHGEMTIRQLSEIIGITTMGIRQHLAALAQEGLVQCRMQRQKVGRPVQVFRLTDSANALFPSNYGALVISLLEQLEALDGPGKVQALFRSRQDRLCADYQERLRGLDLEQRFRALAMIRNQDGYMCECAQRPEGNHCLVQYHCPICEVARRYPELCAMELGLLEEALGTRLERQEHQMSGGRCCSYVQVP